MFLDGMSLRKMHKKRKAQTMLVVLTCILTAGGLSGCGMVPEVNVSDEESQLIAEYAAGLLLKYDSAHTIGLEKIIDKPIETAPIEETAEEVLEEDDTGSTAAIPATSAESLQGASTQDASLLDDSLPQASMAEAMELSGFEVTYQNYEVCKIYPEEQSADMVFSMQASPGKDLLILHFNITNTSESEQLCDMVSSDVLFRLLVNGNQRINEQTTILLNDLKQYQNTIAGFGMEDAVLVFEIEEGTQDSFEALNLLIENEDTTNSFVLM